MSGSLSSNYLKIGSKESLVHFTPIQVFVFSRCRSLISSDWTPQTHWSRDVEQRLINALMPPRKSLAEVMEFWDWFIEWGGIKHVDYWTILETEFREWMPGSRCIADLQSLLLVNVTLHTSHMLLGCLGVFVLFTHRINLRMTTSPAVS